MEALLPPPLNADFVVAAALVAAASIVTVVSFCLRHPAGERGDGMQPCTPLHDLCLPIGTFGGGSIVFFQYSMMLVWSVAPDSVQVTLWINEVLQV